MSEEQIYLPNEPTRFTPANLHDLLEHCENLHASDITIQTSEPVFAEVYGRLLKVTQRQLSNTEVGDLINGIYGPNGTAMLLGGQDIDTHYEFKPTRAKRYRYRINATACMVEGHDGIQITIRPIPGAPPALATMDLDQVLLDAIEPPEGVIYVTGSTGSGKSTLLASIIRDIIEKKESHRKVLTYEAPIEFVYDDIETESAIVSQSEIPRHIPTFADGVRNALRRKPRLILVGEARDPETISAVIDAALTGHPVYTTLHTTGVAETIRRLVTAFPADERHGRTIDILETIRLSIWQKLVPTVDGKRVALREYLVFDEEVRELLLNTPVEEVTSATRKLLKERGQTMEDEAKRKFEAGIIPEHEYRIMVAGSKNLDVDLGL